MNIATKQRILAALRNTISSAPSIAADFGVPTKVVRDMAEEYGINMSTRAMDRRTPRVMASDVEPIWAGRFDVSIAADAVSGSRALLKRQLETGQYNGAARQAWLERHAVPAEASVDTSDPHGGPRIPDSVYRYAEDAAHRHNVNANDVLSDPGCRRASAARQDVMRRLYGDGFSSGQIARWLRRDHTTVLHAVRG